MDYRKAGSNIAILSVGSMVSVSLKASEILDFNGINSEVVNCRFIKPLDSYLDDLVNKFEHVFTIEEGT